MKTIALVAMAAAGSGWGVTQYGQGREIEEVLPAAAEGVLTVRAPHAIVTIDSWDRGEIRVTGTRGNDDDIFEAGSDHGHAQIRLTPHRDNHSPQLAKLWITVPSGSSVDVETSAGDVTVSGVQGLVRLQSHSGDLRVEGRPEGIVVLSQSGDIDVQVPDARGIAHSEEGTVRLQGGSGGSNDLFTSRESHRARQMARTRTARYSNRDCISSRRGRWYDDDCESAFDVLGDVPFDKLEDLVTLSVRESTRALQNLGGFISVDRWDSGLGIEIGGGLDIEFDFDELGEMLESLGEQISAGMEELAEELDDEFHDYRDRERDRRRERRRR